MKLNMQHAREFARILGSNDLKPESLEPDGNFKFGLKDGTCMIDPGMVAGLIQLEKSVSRGQSPEEALEQQIAQIRKSLGC